MRGLEAIILIGADSGVVSEVGSTGLHREGPQTMVLAQTRMVTSENTSQRGMPRILGIAARDVVAVSVMRKKTTSIPVVEAG